MKFKCVSKKIQKNVDFFELGNGTPSLVKYGIYPYGLVVLIIIVITEATLRIDSKYL